MKGESRVVKATDEKKNKRSCSSRRSGYRIGGRVNKQVWLDRTYDISREIDEWIQSRVEVHKLLKTIRVRIFIMIIRVYSRCEFAIAS